MRLYKFNRAARGGDTWRIAVLFSMLVSIGMVDPEPTLAQDSDDRGEPLVTDRPDFTESTEAVAPGRFQLEAGYTFTYDREDDARSRNHTAPELLLRVGVIENLELRFGWEGYSWFNERTPVAGGGTTTTSDQGSNDLSFGLKVKLLEQDGLIPHFAILGSLSAPSGSSNVSSGDVDPQIGLLWAYDLSDSLALAGNVNFAVPTDAGDRFFQTSASISLAMAINEQWGGYIEYFGFYPNSEHTDAAHSMNGGVTYLVTNDFQLDLRAGFGINEEADDFFVGTGFAWRF